MPGLPWSREDLDIAIKLYEQGMKPYLIGKHLSIDRTAPAVKQRMESLGVKFGCKREQTTVDRRVGESVGLTHEFSGNSGRVSGNVLLDDRIRNETDLARVCGIDLREWEIESWTCKAWEMGYKDRDGEGQRQQLFAVTAKLKRNQAGRWLETLVQEILAENPIPERGKTPKRAGKARRRELMAILGPVDHHVGKLCWPRETLGDPYDTEIARRLFTASVDHFCEVLPLHECEKVVVMTGQDLLHVDTIANTTTAGTPQDVDGRWSRSALLARDLVTYGVERLLKSGAHSVELWVVPGNHDRQTAQCLGWVWEAYWKNDPRVKVFVSPASRHYFAFGQNAFLLMHGDEVKRENVHGVFAAEDPRLWGESRYREVISGHIHQRRIEEQYGCTVRTLATLVPPDAWHSKKGYVGKVRGSEALVYHRDYGIQSTHFVTADMLESLIERDE